MIWKSSRCTMPRMVCRVVCGRLEVIATFVPTRALVRVDLPVLGRPTKHTKPEWNSLTGDLSPNVYSARVPAEILAMGARWAHSRRIARPAGHCSTAAS